MSYGFYYGYGVICLPGACAELLPEMSPEEAKVLLCLGAHPELLRQTHTEKGKSAIAAVAGIEVQAVEPILTKLAAGSVLVNDSVIPKTQETTPYVEEEAPPHTEKTAPPKKEAYLPKHDIPSYSPAEVARIMGNHPSTPSLIRDLQKEMGKTFSEHEISSIAAFIDHFGLSDDYLYTLFHYMNKIEKTNMRYIERTVIGLTDDGITTVDRLEQRFDYLNEKNDLENRVRRIMGINNRAFTTAEERCIKEWTEEKLSDDMLSFAYDETVNHLGKPSMPYMNKILTKCREKGITTRAMAEADAMERKQLLAAGGITEKSPAKKKSKKPEGLHSFDTASFLEAALAHSFEDLQEDGNK